MPRKNMSAERKEDILKTFGSCLRESEYHNITIREIAKRAGLPIGSINYYFQSKDALLVEYYRNTLDGYYHEFEKWSESVSPEICDFSEFYDSFVNFSFEYYQYEKMDSNSNAIYIHYYNLVFTTPALHELVIKENRKHAELIARTIQKTKLPCEDPLSLAYALLSVLDGCSLFCGAMCSNVDRKQLLVALFASLKNK